MAEIYVHFTHGDGIAVFPMRMPVFAGETIHWRVVSDNIKVRRVRITFAGQHPPLFSTGGGQAIFYSKYGGGTVVSGVAPVVHSSQALKYSVIGLAKNGRRLPGAYLDPVIIIDPPGYPPTPKQ